MYIALFSFNPFLSLYLKQGWVIMFVKSPLTIFWYNFVIKINHICNFSIYCYGDLNENGPNRLIYLNSWFPTVELFLGRVSCVTRGRLWGFQTSPHSQLVLYLCLLLVACDSSKLSVTASAACMPAAVLPSLKVRDSNPPGLWAPQIKCFLS